MQVQADDILDLGRQLRVGGELEGLGAPGLDAVLAPDAGHGVVTDAQLTGQQPSRPVGDPQSARGRGERELQDLGAAGSSDGLGSAWPGPVRQPIQPAAGVPASAGDHGRA
jgi:hypothetical protein